MLAAARVILAFVGAITILLGLYIVSMTGGRFTGLVTVLIGGAILIALVYERLRYRSQHADASHEPIGPGGGEPGGTVPAGFRATGEVFVDPTSGQRMRVYAQPATGARRYVAEGDAGKGPGTDADPPPET